MQSSANANKLGIFPIASSSSQLPDVQDVGLKGLNLMRMARIGLPVPDGFVISTQACEESISTGDLSDELLEAIRSRLENLENSTGLGFGGRKPLLLSVRSSAAVSMPGMMATVLDVGLCDSTAKEMLRMTGNPSLVWDSYRRLIQSYAEVIRSYGGQRFDDIAKAYLDKQYVERRADLDALSMRSLVGDYLKAFKDETGEPFPQEPTNQLLESVMAVFKSWESPRASEYRRLQKIRGVGGTAVIVERMVYGNMGATSGSGVAFTRDPATGEKQFYLDFLFNAQGEDVVSGTRALHGTERLSLVQPRVYSELQTIGSALENEFKDMQDMEFTVQEGKLFLLQCRDGKRTSWAAVKIAVDLVAEGMIDKETALGRLRGLDLDSVQRTVVVHNPDLKPVARGVPAGHGVAVGRVAIDYEGAKRISEAGAPAVLVRKTIATSDVSAMAISSGVLTVMGGRTSHAALLARHMDKVCVVGCGGISILTERRAISIASKVVPEGEYVSIDGNDGDVYIGEVATLTERPPEVAVAKSWSERIKIGA